MLRLRSYPALLLALVPLPALAAGLGTASTPGVPWVRIVFAFLFCIALAAAAIAVLRHQQGRLRLTLLTRAFPGLAQAPHRRIDVIETRRISQHGDVCLLHCGGHSYLIAMGQAHAVLLDRQALPTGSDTERAP